MPISINKYIMISSVVLGADVLPQQQLIGRLITDNNLLPPFTIREFTSATAVGNYFGNTSPEYVRAVSYFGYRSPTFGLSPTKISFARWVDSAVAPRIYGAKTTETLSAWNAITNGAFSMTLGGVTHVISGLDFSGAGSLAAVATIIQTAINAETGIQWTGATVSYNSISGGFDFVGGSAVAADISIQAPGSGTDISQVMGWGSLAIFAPGAAVQTLTSMLNGIIDVNTNFGSFAFIPVLDNTQQIEVATWNKLQGVQYQYYTTCTASNYVATQEALNTFAGTGLIYNTISDQYPELFPMAIMAATDYTRKNGTQNYMYQSGDWLPSVTTTELAVILDNLNINYVGNTQTAGEVVSFFQDGVLFGGINDPLDMNTYANEQWLKSSILTAIMNLLLTVKVSYNPQGEAQILAIMQPSINTALLNGTFSVGKTLSPTQISEITEITGDDNAWMQVQNVGYWVTVFILSSINPINGKVNYGIKYTLIYSKDDVIRQVSAQDILI